jgi:hypothetical protein
MARNAGSDVLGLVIVCGRRPAPGATGSACARRTAGDGAGAGVRVARELARMLPGVGDPVATVAEPQAARDQVAATAAVAATALAEARPAVADASRSDRRGVI